MTEMKMSDKFKHLLRLEFEEDLRRSPEVVSEDGYVEWGGLELDDDEKYVDPRIEILWTGYLLRSRRHPLVTVK